MWKWCRLYFAVLPIPLGGGLSVVWVFISEIFPKQTAFGQSLGSLLIGFLRLHLPYFPQWQSTKPAVIFRILWDGPPTLGVFFSSRKQAFWKKMEAQLKSVRFGQIIGQTKLIDIGAKS
jgi:hypothetical protein